MLTRDRLIETAEVLTMAELAAASSHGVTQGSDRTRKCRSQRCVQGYSRKRAGKRTKK